MLYIRIIILIAFIFNSLGISSVKAQEFILPKPGVMVRLSPPMDPPVLKGIKVHPDNPFKFDFILDKGDTSLSNEELKDESNKLIKYFLASLTIPERDLWVNLSPYEKDRIIPISFGVTEMGRDLLAEDYLLKQITASLIYPEDEVGKKFWKRIYEEAQKKYGTTNIPVNTFNKVWIVPDKAVIYENAKVGAAYVSESKLKVMLEEDYLSLEKHNNSMSSPNVSVGYLEGGQSLDARQKHSGMTNNNDTHSLGSQIVREIVIPELTKEINEGKNFAKLRQVYNSLILAAWYKKKIKDSILSQVYADKSKTQGVNIDDPQEKEKIYKQYLQAFKKGVYNYIKEDPDPVTGEKIPRKYFSGGVAFAMSNPGVTSLQANSAMQIKAASLENMDGLNGNTHLDIIQAGVVLPVEPVAAPADFALYEELERNVPSELSNGTVFTASESEQKAKNERAAEKICNLSPGTLQHVRRGTMHVYRNVFSGEYYKIFSSMGLANLPLVIHVVKLLNEHALDFIMKTRIERHLNSQWLVQEPADINAFDLDSIGNDSDKRLIEEVTKQNPFIGKVDESPLMYEIAEATKYGGNVGLVLRNGKVYAYVFDFNGVSNEDLQKGREKFIDIIAHASPMAGVPLDSFSSAVRERILKAHQENQKYQSKNEEQVMNVDKTIQPASRAMKSAEQPSSPLMEIQDQELSPEEFRYAQASMRDMENQTSTSDVSNISRRRFIFGVVGAAVLATVGSLQAQNLEGLKRTSIRTSKAVNGSSVVIMGHRHANGIQFIQDFQDLRKRIKTGDLKIKNFRTALGSILESQRENLDRLYKDLEDLKLRMRNANWITAEDSPEEGARASKEIQEVLGTYFPAIKKKDLFNPENKDIRDLILLAMGPVLYTQFLGLPEFADKRIVYLENFKVKVEGLKLLVFAQRALDQLSALASANGEEKGFLKFKKDMDEVHVIGRDIQAEGRFKNEDLKTIARNIIPMFRELNRLNLIREVHDLLKILEEQKKPNNPGVVVIGGFHAPHLQWYLDHNTPDKFTIEITPTGPIVHFKVKAPFWPDNVLDARVTSQLAAGVKEIVSKVFTSPAMNTQSTSRAMNIQSVSSAMTRRGFTFTTIAAVAAVLFGIKREAQAAPKKTSKAPTTEIKYTQITWQVLDEWAKGAAKAYKTNNMTVTINRMNDDEWKRYEIQLGYDNHKRAGDAQKSPQGVIINVHSSDPNNPPVDYIMHEATHGAHHLINDDVALMQDLYNFKKSLLRSGNKKALDAFYNILDILHVRYSSKSSILADLLDGPINDENVFKAQQRIMDFNKSASFVKAIINMEDDSGSFKTAVIDEEAQFIGMKTKAILERIMDRKDKGIPVSDNEIRKQIAEIRAKEQEEGAQFSITIKEKIDLPKWKKSLSKEDFVKKVKNLINKTTNIPRNDASEFYSFMMQFMVNKEIEKYIQIPKDTKSDPSKKEDIIYQLFQYFRILKESLDPDAAKQLVNHSLRVKLPVPIALKEIIEGTAVTQPASRAMKRRDFISETFTAAAAIWFGIGSQQTAEAKSSKEKVSAPLAEIGMYKNKMSALQGSFQDAIEIYEAKPKTWLGQNHHGIQLPEHNPKDARILRILKHIDDNLKTDSNGSLINEKGFYELWDGLKDLEGINDPLIDKILKNAKSLLGFSYLYPPSPNKPDLIIMPGAGGEGAWREQVKGLLHEQSQFYNIKLYTYDPTKPLAKLAEKFLRDSNNINLNGEPNAVVLNSYGNTIFVETLLQIIEGHKVNPFSNSHVVSLGFLAGGTASTLGMPDWFIKLMEKGFPKFDELIEAMKVTNPRQREYAEKMQAIQRLPKAFFFFWAMGDPYINPGYKKAPYADNRRKIEKTFNPKNFLLLKVPLAKEVGNHENNHTNLLYAREVHEKLQEIRKKIRGGSKTNNWAMRTQEQSQVSPGMKNITQIITAAVGNIPLLLNSNEAQASRAMKGGIDFNIDKLNLQIQNSGEGGIKFKLDPEMLQQLRNAPGFEPLIIDIKPMTDLKVFMGLV